MEEADGGNDVVCAIRETSEEVGLESHDVRPVCKLHSIASPSGLVVTPVVAGILASPFDVGSLRLCAGEVDAAFVVPLKKFIAPHETEEVEFKGEHYVMRTFYHLCESSGREFKIWGLTAGICHEVARIALVDER